MAAVGVDKGALPTLSFPTSMLIVIMRFKGQLTSSLFEEVEILLS